MHNCQIFSSAKRSLCIDNFWSFFHAALQLALCGRTANWKALDGPTSEFSVHILLVPSRVLSPRGNLAHGVKNSAAARAEIALAPPSGLPWGTLVGRSAPPRAAAV